MEASPTVRLLNLSPEVCAAVLSGPPGGPAEWLQGHALHYSAPIESLVEIVQQSLDFMNHIGGDARYFGYLGIDTSSGEIVGICGFKGPPTERGELEIAYYTFPHCEGLGYGSAMAKKLLELTPTWGKVKTIIAHTPAEISPATVILEQIGMRQIGEIADPEEGTIWRWMCMN